MELEVKRDRFYLQFLLFFIFITIFSSCSEKDYENFELSNTNSESENWYKTEFRNAYYSIQQYWNESVEM